MYLFAIQLGLAIIGILIDWFTGKEDDAETDAAAAVPAGKKLSAKKEKA